MKKNILKLAGIILAVSVLSGCNITIDPATDRDEKDEETTKETTSADEEETEGSEASEETSGSEETSVTTTAAESDADSNDDQGVGHLALEAALIYKFLVVTVYVTADHYPLGIWELVNIIIDIHSLLKLSLIQTETIPRCTIARKHLAVTSTSAADW